MIARNGNGDDHQPEVAAADMPLFDRPAYIAKHFAHLIGTPIWVSEAARKYGIPSPTISVWTKHGHIKQIEHDKNRVLLDEADVAYCAKVHEERGGQGRWLFNKDGTPYVPARAAA
ncbi:MAG: MerR family transcriptional regulator [Chloroflexi bacterium]|nr:MerR family transcriptional regulator [Chloroflexota bacterium]